MARPDSQVTLVGNDGELVDSSKHGLVLVEVAHARIHQGVFFTGSVFDLAVADDASLDVLWRPAVGSDVHARGGVSVAGDSELFVFEDPTISATGSVVPLQNRNRQVSITPTLQIFSGPTVTTPGTELEHSFLGAGQKKEAGGNIVIFDEWLLNDQLDYLVRVFNRSGAAASVSVSTGHYETQLVPQPRPA